MAVKRASSPALGLCRRAMSIPGYGIGTNRAGDVFEVLLAQIGELNPNLAANLIVGGRRYANAAGLCNAFKPCRNIYAVAKNVMRLDNHVADIDADAESNPSIFRIGGREFFDAGLKLCSGSNRFDRAWKRCQEPVAGILDDAAAVVGDRRRDTIREERCQSGVRGLLVLVH